MPIGPALCDQGKNKPIAINGIKKVFEGIRIRWELAEEITEPYLSLRIATLFLAPNFSECEKCPVSLFICLNVWKIFPRMPLQSDEKQAFAALLTVNRAVLRQSCILICIFNVAGICNKGKVTNHLCMGNKVSDGLWCFLWSATWVKVTYSR